ncbi:DUF262 domain-containing protein [Streptomyces sp. C3-3]|uniref:DUF262 domain-containing protein n=1 Tax=Streptomyces sp. C3-3 TaxID=2824901 RepID=UPI001B35C915|nr:DUF262 domain-containing protein [Streptomyces sp. C3-3]MBQ1112928.1 DUF262 domain-containing protein [Streptomyces sp. C3-3]
MNRRYQRKLVWTVEEKCDLIDSILSDLPIPLILVAEISGEGGTSYELIDGMQRLNAIFSFIENERRYTSARTPGHADPARGSGSSPATPVRHGAGA